MRGVTPGARWKRLLAAAPGNISLGLLSVGIAVVLWVVVSNSENPTETRTVEVRVEAENVPPNLIASGIVPDKVRVVVTGPRNALEDLKQEEVLARVDLSDGARSGDGQQEFTVDARVRARVNHRSLRGEPATETAAVTLERVERRDVKVQLRQVGVLPAGYELESVTVDQPQATVRGTRRNLNSIEAVYADAPLDGQTVSFSRPVPLDARDRDGRTIGGVTVEPATAVVAVKIKQNFYPKQVAVNVAYRGRPKTGYTVTSLRSEPEIVTIIGPLEQINSISGISTEMVDIDGAAGDVQRPARLQALAGISLSQPIVLVTIGIRAERAPGSVAVVPRVIGLGPGLVAQLVTPVVAVNVIGPLGDIVVLRATDVVVTLDTTGLGAGNHRIEPRVALPPALQLDGVVPERVELTIAAPR